jgi:hypothetical protein
MSMTRADFLSIVNGGVGHFTIEWQTDPKPAAAHRARRLRKVTTALCMTGAEYAKLAVNKDTETGALPWGEWAEYPYVVTHKGTDYGRVNTVANGVKSIWTVDGEVVDRKTFESYLTPSQRNAKRPNGGTLTIKLENLRLIGEPVFA